MIKINKLVLASGNAKKLAELTDCLLPLGIELLPQSEFMIEDAEETGLTFVENAIIKARHATAKSGLPALADDSGLEVDALFGAPGIYSSRYADGKGDAANNVKLLERLEGLPESQRTARFRCVLVLMQHEFDPMPMIFSGTWNGIIRPSLSGASGFGYDPLFQPDGFSLTAAELDKNEKNKISHRARAIAELHNYIKQAN